jgi:tetratricopeptide (TPR) repeat protein
MPHDNQPATAKDLFASGNALAASGDYHGALACYEQVRVVRPADPMVYNNIGAALTRLRRPEAAVIAYRRAIGIAPELHASRNNLGNALRDLGRFAEAHDAYRAAIRLAPERAMRCSAGAWPMTRRRCWTSSTASAPCSRRS